MKQIYNILLIIVGSISILGFIFILLNWVWNFVENDLHNKILGTSLILFLIAYLMIWIESGLNAQDYEEPF